MEEQKGKRKFTLGKKAKKPKRRSQTTEVIHELHSVDAKGKPKRSDTLPNQKISSSEANPSTGMNWSVPEDLPGVVGASSPSSSQTPSLDSMFFSLGPHSIARVDHYASNPDIMHVEDSMEHGHFHSFRSQITAGRAAIHSFEAAVQVGADEEVQRFPSPPIYSSSVGSSVPGIRYISPSPSNSSMTSSRHGTPIRNLPPVFEGGSKASQQGSALVHAAGVRGAYEPRHLAGYEHYGGHDDVLLGSISDDDDDDDTYGEKLPVLE